MLFIKELNLISFGKFQDESFQFQEGLNLVCGANEAGKSTLHHFIKGMLFGIERSRGRASKEDPYQGFLPWDNKGCYCGTMDVAEGEQEFRIYRDFLKESKESKLTELRTGHEVQLLSGMELPFAPELTERLYHSTISVPQRQANSSKDLASEYGKYIANLSTTMSNELDTEAAITYLTAKKKKIESLKTEEKLSMCEEKLQELEQAEMKAAQLAKQLEGLLETYQSSDESQGRKQQIGQLKDYADEYSVIREKYIRYQEYKSKSDIIEEQGKNLSRQKKQNKTEIKKLQNLKILKIILIACLTGLVWIILLIILVGITNIVLPGAIGAFVLYLAAAGAVKRAKRKIETGGYLASPERDELKSRHSELQDMMSVLKEEILTYARRYTDITDIDAESMEVLSREIVKLKESVSEKMASMQKEQEDIRLNIERLRWELGNAMHALEDMYEERQKYKELQEIRRSELLELEALAAAAETIKELA